MNREKEIKKLIYLKSELIRKTKKEIKNLKAELNELQGSKKLRKEWWLINRVELLGRVTKDLELRENSNGTKIVKFNIAINRQNEGTDYPSIIVFGKTAENLAKYGYKGMLVAIEGRIQTSSYEDKNKQMHYSTDVIGERVQFLSKKETKEEVKEEPAGDPFQEFGDAIEINSSDLPF